jgi:DNA excision repair protein ERCC-2
MAKSVQAAGRVIRTAEDRGIVVFMDSRFLEPGSQSAMPSQWIDHIHEARHGESLSAHINNFWS